MIQLIAFSYLPISSTSKILGLCSNYLLGILYITRKFNFHLAANKATDIDQHGLDTVTADYAQCPQDQKS